MRITTSIAIGLAGLALATMAQAQAQPRPDAANDPPGRQTGEDDGFFGKVNWGAGLGYVLDFEGKDRVGEAELVNGVVRITDEDDAKVGIMVESHYFFEPQYGSREMGVEAGEWGIGPFVAAQLGNDDLIETVAAGLMFGFRRGSGSSSFNLGFGVAVDPNARILGEGLEANQPLPAGETAIRYKEEAQYGFIIITSFTF